MRHKDHIDLFWGAAKRVSQSARNRYDRWELENFSKPDFFDLRWSWVMAEDEWRVEIMTLVLEWGV